MALEKLKVTSPDLIVKRSELSEAALARFAHVNEVIRQVSTAAQEVGVLGETEALTGTTVATLKAQVEVRLDAIEAKLDALITALS